MKLPKYFSSKQLSLPYQFIYFLCKTTNSDVLGIALWPLPFTILGLILHLSYKSDISRGMWFAIIWMSITTAMLYYGQYRVQNVFIKLKETISSSEEDRDKTELVKARAYAYFNNKYYYIVGLLVVAITLPIFYDLKISSCEFPLLIWNSIFFVYTAFIGGYGMAGAVSFNRVVKTIVNDTPFKLNPYHPDSFMGLKPLGNLAVTMGLLSASSALLFPLIFEATEHLKSDTLSVFLGYLIFSIIMGAIISTFIGPFLLIKDKIEKEKFAFIVKHENEYQQILKDFKQNPSVETQGLLGLLSNERSKLEKIKLFPFEARMLLEIIASISLPIVILIIEKYFN